MPAAMAAHDDATGQPRGYLLLQAQHPPTSVLFTLCAAPRCASGYCATKNQDLFDHTPSGNKLGPSMVCCGLTFEGHGDET